MIINLMMMSFHQSTQSQHQRSDKLQWNAYWNLCHGNFPDQLDLMERGK